MEWESCLTNNGNNKELIPEFYEPDSHEFLSNSLGLDLGVRANGDRVDDIVLPPWAETPKHFLEKHREALESDYVSDNLHKWIDLIFGNKQASLEDFNVFRPISYEGNVDIENIFDPLERHATE